MLLTHRVIKLAYRYCWRQEMMYPNELDVAMVKVKARNLHQINAKFSTPVFIHQWNSVFLLYPIFMISLPVCDIYHTQVYYRARKDLCVLFYRVELY